MLLKLLWLNLALLEASIALVSNPVVQVYKYSDPVLAPIPLPPTCFRHSINESIHSGTIGIWKVDQSKFQNFGLLYWDEILTVSCYSNLLGQITQSVVSRVTTLPAELGTEKAHSLYNSLSTGELKDLNPHPSEVCSWLREINTTTTRSWVKRVTVQRYIDGSIVGFTGSSPNLNLRESTWSNSYQRLYVPAQNSSSCPFFQLNEMSCIIRKSKDDYFITVPSSNLQFSLSLSSIAPHCILDGTSIYMTPEGFLISSPELVIPRTIPINNIERLQPSLVMSRMLYDISHLSELMDSELMEIEKDICSVRRMLWNMAAHLRSADLLAQFTDGNIFSKGTFVSSGLEVQHPIRLLEVCRIPLKRETRGGLLKLNCSDEVRWVIPLASIAVSKGYELKSIYPPILPISEDIFVNYFSGEIVRGPSIPASALQGWKEIEMPNLYHLNEIYHSNLFPESSGDDIFSSSADLEWLGQDWFGVGNWISKIISIAIDITIVITLVKVGSLFLGCWRTAYKSVPVSKI